MNVDPAELTIWKLPETLNYASASYENYLFSTVLRQPVCFFYQGNTQISVITGWDCGFTLFFFIYICFVLKETLWYSRCWTFTMIRNVAWPKETVHFIITLTEVDQLHHYCRKDSALMFETSLLLEVCSRKCISICPLSYSESKPSLSWWC